MILLNDNSRLIRPGQLNLHTLHLASPYRGKFCYEILAIVNLSQTLISFADQLVSSYLTTKKKTKGTQRLINKK